MNKTAQTSLYLFSVIIFVLGISLLTKRFVLEEDDQMTLDGEENSERRLKSDNFIKPNYVDENRKITNRTKLHIENSSLEKELIQLAREATKDVFIPNNIAPTIKYVSNNKYAIITWPYLQENPYPGPEFYVEVTIDKKTKKVIEIMTSG